MGYYIVRRQSSPVPGPSDAVAPDAAGLCEQLENGSPGERGRALQQLVAVGAEKELTFCLASGNPAVIQLAISGLWECWLNEEGPAARQDMDAGIAAMNQGDLEAAAATFARLMERFPHWAEAINKQATVLYLQGRLEESIDLCRRVVARKPDHFGAWNGLALCAIHLEHWEQAYEAVQECLRLQPRSSINKQLHRLVESRLREA